MAGWRFMCARSGSPCALKQGHAPAAPLRAHHWALSHSDTLMSHGAPGPGARAAVRGGGALGRAVPPGVPRPPQRVRQRRGRPQREPHWRAAPRFLPLAPAPRYASESFSMSAGGGTSVCVSAARCFSPQECLWFVASCGGERLQVCCEPESVHCCGAQRHEASPLPRKCRRRCTTRCRAQRVPGCWLASTRDGAA